MDEEESQLLEDDPTFEDIFVKNEPLSNLESRGNSFSQPRGKRRKMENTADNNEINEPISEPSITTVSGEKKKKKHVPLDPFEKDIMKILEGNRSKFDYSVRDPDAMFFISHVPVIKRFNPREKLDFQIKFMQLLQSYHLPSVTLAIENQAVSSEITHVDDDPSIE